MPYGVQGFAPGGSGSSPRCAIQMRSGVSAKTAPTDPQVQPVCLIPSASSGSGCGQFSTSSYGPNSSCPPFSCAAAAPGTALAEFVGAGAVHPMRIAAATSATSVRDSEVRINILLSISVGPTGQAIVGTPLRGLFDGLLAGPPTPFDYRREFVFGEESNVCLQKRQKNSHCGIRMSP